MSEYQYYEFRAVDRRLTNDEMQALRQISSRAKITPMSFVNVYNYGDFRGNPLELMERYFDLHIYVANWGTRVLMIRVPSSLLDADAAGEYAPDMPVIARSHGGHTIVEIQSDDEDGREWEEGDGWMDRLATLRDELMNGDMRALYIGWLLLTMYDDPGSDEPEPPVPPGLRQLSPAQKALVEFLRVDKSLLAVAAERSESLRDTTPREDELRVWIEQLPAADKDDLLLRAMLGSESNPGSQLLKEFRRSSVAASSVPSATPRRTAGELIETWQRKVDERNRAKAEREAQAHAARMNDIVERAEELWREADALADNRNLKSYNVAIAHLNDLHDAAKHFGTLDEFGRRLERLEAKHSRKTSFVNLLKTVGVPKTAPSGVLVSWTFEPT